MVTLDRAPPEVIRQVNHRPPNGKNFMSPDELNALSRFGQVGYCFNRLQFAKASAPKPDEGKHINQHIDQLRGQGKVTLIRKPGCTPFHIQKRMRKDPQIALGLAAIKAPIMAAFGSIKVECRRADIRGFVRHVLMNESGGLLRRAVYSALNGLDFGFIAHEKVWENGATIEYQMDPDGSGEPKSKKSHNTTVLRGVNDLDPAHTEVFVDGMTGDYRGIRYASGKDQVLPPEKTWLVTHDKEFGDLLGRPLLDNIYNAWYWCDIMYLFTNRYFERKASPPIKGRAPSMVTDDNGVTKSGVDIFTEMLNSLISEGIIVLPSEMQEEGMGRNATPVWDVEFLTDDKRGEMFQRYIEHLQTLKLRGLLMPEMVVERGAAYVGSYAMATAHTETFIQILTLILEEVLSHINKYLIPDIVLHNFGSGAPPCTVDTLTKIGERRDLLTELLFEIIRAESKTGSLDTERIVDIIGLLRQLNIDVQPRRDLPDYQHQVAQEDAVIKIQKEQAKAKAEAGTGGAEWVGKPAATPKVLPPPQKTRPQEPKVAPEKVGAMDQTPSLEERVAKMEAMVTEVHDRLTGAGDGS